MECFKHPGRDVNAFCDECGKGLCRECAAAFKPCLCPDCALARSKAATTGEIKTILVKSAIFFVISFVVTKLLFSAGDTKIPLSANLFMALVFSGVPWGWSFISRLVPVSPFGTMGFLAFFYMLKFGAAYFIGLFVMVWNIIKICYLFYKGKSEKKLFQQIDEGLSGD